MRVLQCAPITHVTNRVYAPYAERRVIFKGVYSARTALMLKQESAMTVSAKDYASDVAGARWYQVARDVSNV